VAVHWASHIEREYADSILTKSPLEVFIIGGAKTYKSAVDHCYIDKIYHTLIDDEHLSGDTYYTPDLSKYEPTYIRRKHDDTNTMNYKFIVYSRIRSRFSDEINSVG
jgi:dihydrofolate reductase